MLLQCCQNITNEIDWKEFFPIISPIVVIVLFLIERILSYYIRKREIERTWYYKVLLDPSLKQIDDFFNNSLVYYSNSCEVLKNSQSLSHEKYNSLKSAEIGNFQKIKRSFDSDVITPINHRYPNVGSVLQNLLLDLEDNFSNRLDNELFSQDDIDSFHMELSSLKAEWLNTLYKPIE